MKGPGLDFTAFHTARPFTAIDNSTPIDYLGVLGDRAMGRDVVEEMRREPADVVVIDCILFGAMAATAAQGVPCVVLEHMYDAYLVRKWLRGPMGIGMAVKRIRARELLNAAAARLVACIPELDPAGLPSAHGRSPDGRLSSRRIVHTPTSMPPPTSSSAPVTNAASPEHKYEDAAATSCGTPLRPSGVIAVTASASPGRPSL